VDCVKKEYNFIPPHYSILAQRKRVGPIVQ